MAIPIGTHLGAHEITAWLGKGGMGEVYRARDTRLKREVAIKILPEEFSRDADRVSRFQREAEVLASLNHPNIAHIYGLEESGGMRGIVMELVDGETLQERLSRGPIPIEEALPMARQIASALESAHERGIIHRDLKPANIKLTGDGQIKVLDFGLAKAFQQQQTASFSNSPTIMYASVPGVILGTAAYMSPEQAKGREADRGSDVWAFGCVLYEMLTARRAFEGETISEIFAGVLKGEPDWKLLPVGASFSIRRLLRRCLEKDRKERVQHMGDARLELSEAGIASVSETEPAGKLVGSRLLIAAVIAAISVGIALGWFVASRTVTASPEVRFEFTTPPTPDPVSLAVSPDGRQIVFVGTLENRQLLWIRSLNSTSNRPLTGTEGGFYPFWSPDGRSLGFFGDGKLKIIDIDGGLVRELANAPNPVGGTWNRDGTILFTPNYTGPIFRITAAGGEAVPLTKVEGKQAGHRFPQFLPDGRTFLYYVPSDEEVRGVYLGRLDNSVMQRLFDADAPAVYTTGHLLFVRQGRLITQAFDPVKGTLSGNLSPLADQFIGVVGDSHAAGLAASGAGVIAYRGGAGGGLQKQFIWFDRSGKEISRVGRADDGNPLDPNLSPDGRRIGEERTVNGNSDVWILDVAQGLQSRLTFEMSTEADPIWSPDGKRVVFNSNRSGVFDLYQKQIAGGSEELLLSTPQNKAATDWSSDGRFILFRSPGPTTGFDLWALPMDGDRKPFPVVQTRFEERDGQFSSDGKWIAYQSNEFGRTEVLLQPFPGPGGKVQVSPNGGAQVRWRRDGKELFYIALDGRLMAVPIRFLDANRSAEVGSPVPLFATHVGGAIQGTNTTSYAVSPDGRQFLMNSIVNESSTSPITVILNWKTQP